MKRILLTLTFIISTLVSFSQTDSTKIYYKNIEDRNLRTICDLSDIQIEKIFCNDTLLRGKVFNVIIKELKKGKVNSTKNLNISAEKQQIPMVVNGDTLIYEIDYTDKTGFGNSTESLTLTFAGILKKDKFKLKIEYPGLGITQELNGKENYSLRAINSSSDNIKVPVNNEFPILAYTPPFDTGTGLNSYCMLEEESVLDWYEKFKVKHYYVIYLEIK
ncbi:MAG TPA: hypothetical protein VK982_13090 [Bacteroidales bacterium]|nr:hypothetical protein [Bacteroidales bacterium]